MFSRPERLRKRTPVDGVDRFEYLRRLVNEFKAPDTAAHAKEQVLANLANFAYDPINFGFLRSLDTLHLFLDQLSESNTTLVRFAIAGLCNLAADPENCEYIAHTNGINAIANCLYQADEDIQLSALATLVFLGYACASAMEKLSPDIVEYVKQRSRTAGPRLKNVARIFLENRRNRSTS